MKTHSYYRRTLPFALLAVCLSQWPAWGAETVPATVGDLGRKEALVFEGNKVFAATDLRNGLRRNLDYHLAAHPSAPLAGYTRTLERLLLAGYQRGGFPEAKVTVLPEATARRILVKIAEGPRYRCGEIRLSGVPRLTTDEVKRKISHALGPNVDAEGIEYGMHGTWMPDHGAPFDEVAKSNFTQRISAVLKTNDCYEPELRLKVLPDPARQRADLVVEVAGEGPQGVIAHIEVIGTRKNTQEDVLRFVELKPGQPVDPKLLTSIHERLWNSARFLKHEVIPSPLEQPGHYKLTLDLAEFKPAPSLNEELSPEQKAILKFCDWVNKDYTSAGNLVVDLNAQGISPTRKERIHLDYRGILSELGMVVLGKTRDTNGHPHLQYAVVATSELFGLYSPSQQRKLVMSSSRLPFSPLVQFMPSGRAESESPIDLTLGLSGWNRESPKPQWMGIRMAPVAALSALADAHSTSIDNGVLTVKRKGSELGPEDEMELKINAASGRLINLASTITGDLIENGKFVLHVHPQTGAFAQALGEIDALTEDYPNAFAQTNRIGSTLAFLGTDLLGSDLLKRALDDPSVPESRRQMVRLLQKVDLARLLAPLDSLWTVLSTIQDESITREPFVVPDDTQSAAPQFTRLGMPTPIDPATLVKMARFLVLQMLRKSDSLWPWGSWPWTFTREATLNMVNEGQYTAGEVARLAASDATGPLACLIGSKLLKGCGPRLAEECAKAGLGKVSLAACQKDIHTLLHGESAGQVAMGYILPLLDSPSADALVEFAGTMEKDGAKTFQEALTWLRAHRHQTPAQVAEAFLAERWEQDQLATRLRAALEMLMPITYVPTTASVQLQRGLLHLKGVTVERNLELAADYIRKAAEQGHAGAQWRLGRLYLNGAGMAQSHQNAIVWLRKAAEQRYPNAASDLAGLYEAGQGVPKDAKEAQRWFRQDAQQDCVAAQVSLARLLMIDSGASSQDRAEAVKWLQRADQNNDETASYWLGVYHEQQKRNAEAMRWYRHAAAKGSIEAQHTLGQRLRDGRGAQPNLVDACAWFSVAAAQGHEASATELALLRPGLAANQLQEAETQAAAFLKTASATLSAKAPGYPLLAGAGSLGHAVPAPQPAPNQSNDVTVARILIVLTNLSAQQITEPDIRACLTLKEGDSYVKSAVDDSIRILYRTGRFREIRVREEARGKKVVLTFIVQGRPMVTGIRFKGHTAYSRRQLLNVGALPPDGSEHEATLETMTGQLLDERGVFFFARLIETLYEDRGYTNTQVTYSIQDIHGDRVVIWYEIREGPW